MRKFRSRLTVVAAVALCSTVLQLGGCMTAGINGLLATFDFCAVLGPDCTLGPIAPCGDPTTDEDDLLLDCPPPTAIAP
ncbi:MAG: hypothetical protein HUU22_07275 [Phycisphaerae bacterium]|nr:hypothetical protein [Phycisphaerae bacterium]NUQ45818.1 hypothetical protein [Phycisphaerae bacterium]